MDKLEKVIKVLEGYKNHAFGDKDNKCTVSEIIDLLKAQKDNCRDCAERTSACIQELQGKLKTQEPNEDWISRKRLKDEIQYYIDEAGWGDEANKVLGWCMEFIDNQMAVKWE